jgi:xanthine dehydrogenase accessory factor
MLNWLSALVTQTAPAVLVTVARAEGSVPRKTGAKMLVGADMQVDTIGGGHLELQACEIARAMLASGASRLLQRFALGPGLGQCCGGVAHLAFERIEPASAALESLRRGAMQSRDVWRLVDLDGADSLALDDLADAPFFIDHQLPCRVVEYDSRRWLVDPCRAARAQLLLFGAGHVGSAIVRALAELPCQVRWVDARDELFPAEVPANVTPEATDTPAALVDAASAGTSYLVTTHSHALDMQLTEQILRRADAGWFGLIGSHTKRSQFEHRLRERGITAERIATMVCPIGIAGISGKAPAVIAAAVAAQLLQVWETQHLLENL